MCWTSGSSGSPKGAMLEHRGLPRVIADQVRAFELDPSARSLWLLRPAFDASLSDVFSCLLAGGELHLAPELDSAFTQERLLRALGERGITHADLPPSLLPRIPADQLPSSLRCVIIGGEAPDFPSAAAWARKLTLINVYGPTECSICTSLLYWRPGYQRAYIGEPLSAVEYRVGAEDGDEGELWIAGEQLARGYWQAPELDARRFVEHAGKRWYRTGDRVRRDDAQLYFVGRVDRQLKWRGQLIAPEEVEAELVRSGACSRAYVGVHQDRLVAVVSADVSAEPALRDHLSERLPRWMHPTDYRFQLDLPETPSGKLDLSSLYTQVAANGEPQSPPQDLLEIVRTQLGHVDPSKSYFAQGGDSLGVLEVLSQAESLGLRLKPEQLASDRPLGALQAGDAQSEDTASGAFLDADARACLDRVTTAIPRGNSGERSWTLVTGATGFLGARCLLSLLEQDPARCFVALVRAQNPEQARERLRAACDAHAPGAFAHLSGERLRCITGDVSRPDLGLSKEAYAWLLANTHEVIHGAARVNLVLPYAVMRPANLLGTAEVLRFCRLAQVSRLHYASTLSVFAATDRCPAECFERDPLDLAAQVSGGYAQSKWAAERLLELCADHVPISCYRFGLITGDSHTGYAPSDDWLTRVSRAFVALGCAPSADLAFDLTPVDYAAHAWASLIDRARPAAFTRYHVSNGSVSLARWVAALNEAGAHIKQVPTETFEGRLGTHTVRTEQAHLTLATTRTHQPSRLDARRGLDLFQATGVRFDCKHAEEQLASLGVRPPGATQTLLSSYAAHLLEGARG
ncbi:MAG: thioester reductase domain-containing protein [Polyangiaceae bacterium]